jgi:histidine-containing phosphotransfer peotein
VLQDDSNPDFVSEMVELYFEDSAGKIEKLESKLHEDMIDFNEIDQLVHQFKGSSASFGAHAMALVCVQLREACHEQHVAACRELVRELKSCFIVLQQRLEQFLQLETRRKQLVGGQ